MTERQYASLDAAHAEALVEDSERADGTAFDLTRRETTVEFKVTTTDKVTSFRGTEFVPNHCDAKLSHGKILSVTLSKLSEDGWGIDDPAGPDGAELHADFGGGEIEGMAITRLPQVAQEALAAIEWATR